MIKILLLAGLMTVSVWAQRVRVVHASPDAPAVDIAVDGAIAFSGLPFGAWTDYTTLPTGQRIFQVYAAGTTTKVAEVTANIDGGRDYTVIASGYVTTGKTPAFRVITLEDNNSPAAEGNTRIRVVHAAPGAPAVDVYAVPPYGSLGSATPVLTNVPFGAASGYLQVPSRNYAARVVPTGTKTVAIDSGRLALASGATLTVIAIDAEKGGAPFGFLVLRDR